MNKPEPHAPCMIKICGLRDPDMATECCRLGADAVGLVFYKKSPRHITREMARSITQILPDHIMKTGVFVDNGFDEIMDTVIACGLTAVQLHGDETPELVTALKKEQLQVIKAVFSAKPPFIGTAAQYFNADFLLIEYGQGNLPGGNAESWDYTIPSSLEIKIPIIIAGGLTPDNVDKALSKSRASGVDVSSGVEIYPGKKDKHKIQQFIMNVRSLLLPSGLQIQP